MSFRIRVAIWMVIVLTAAAIWGLVHGALRSGSSWAAFGGIVIISFVVYHFHSKTLPKDGSGGENSN